MERFGHGHGVTLKLIVVAIVLLLLANGSAQELGFWSPEGELIAPFCDTCNNSIASVREQRYPGERTHLHMVPESIGEGDSFPVVLFRWLTAEPLFVLTRFPDRIADYIASYDHAEFLSSWRLEFALSDALANEEVVTDSYMLTALGSPSSRVSQATEFGRTERWEYPAYRLVLYFRDGRLFMVTAY